jgi:diguanylate cyclase (GGDEF)-like protein
MISHDSFGIKIMSVSSLPPEALEKIRILVVDDQVANIVQIKHILGPHLNAYAATSGLQALSMCVSNPPDLVILDVQMPGIDGLETCRRLRAHEDTQAIPVIFVTAGPRPEDEDACWLAGASDFVLKPVNPTTLQNRVRAQLALKSQADQLRQLAYLDGLTGLPNRRSFDERFAMECRRALRNKSPLSIFLLDVDYFKLYNDHYGHVSGDVCLQEIGSCLARSVLRPGDFLARYGGEEFVGILAETDHSGAICVAQAILDRVSKSKLPHAASPIGPNVSVSIGVATWTAKNGNQGLDVGCQTLIEEADRQLYLAKQAGRARVSGSEMPMET